MKILSFDAETDGLWGQPFAIAAIVYARRFIPGGKPWWVETARFMGMLPLDSLKNDWVRENVVPALVGIEPTHNSYEELLRDFATFYLANKDATVICHVGSPVESNLVREMHRLGFIGDWDAPFPLIDIAGNLDQMGEDPTSVDKYVQKYDLVVNDYGTTHNPLYDCEVAAKVYIHLKEK